MCCCRYILSAGVAPFSCGENPMQWYNTLLCTSHLARSSDQVILLRNDHFSPQKLTTTNNNHNNTTPNGYMHLSPLFLYSIQVIIGTVRSETMLVCNGNDGPEFKGVLLLLKDEIVPNRCKLQ